MEDVITAAEANRRFSSILRGVRAGRHYLVTSHGTPVARILPAGEKDHAAAMAMAKRLLLERLDSQAVLGLPRLSRDEFYDE